MFSIQNSSYSPDYFAYYYSKYDPSYSRPIYTETYPIDDIHIKFTEVLNAFEHWLIEECLTAVEEELLPDLWSQIPRLSYDQKATSVATSEFSTEEGIRIKLALDSFRLLIINKFSPDNEQLTAIGKQLDYLKAAVDRLNRFDWGGVVLTTLIGIATNLCLDTEKGSLLYGLFRQAFSALLHLIPEFCAKTSYFLCGLFHAKNILHRWLTMIIP